MLVKRAVHQCTAVGGAGVRACKGTYQAGHHRGHDTKEVMSQGVHDTLEFMSEKGLRD